MRIEIVGKDYKPADKLKEIIEKKVEKFSKYFDDLARARIVLKEIGNDKFGMEVTITFDGSNFIRSEVFSNNMYDNIDVVLPKVEGQIRKYKTRNDKKRKENSLGQVIYAEIEAARAPELVRTKTIKLEVMSVDDALAALDMTGHDFYLFVDGATGKVGTVYVRRDGDIGYLELKY